MCLPVPFHLNCWKAKAKGMELLWPKRAWYCNLKYCLRTQADRTRLMLRRMLHRSTWPCARCRQR